MGDRQDLVGLQMLIPSFIGAFYSVIGDWDTTMQAVTWGMNTPATGFATFIVSLYAFIAQIALVNLLIAMMSATFESVKENSEKVYTVTLWQMEVARSNFKFTFYRLVHFLLRNSHSLGRSK